MGIIKISDDLHDEVRTSSQVMSRSINAQAEFWIKMGRLAEQNPTLTFADIIAQEMHKASTTDKLKAV
ncbi:ParD-like family protein [Marinomonas sp. THO17]|uniref:ParD-like family protein n=1 Tax=Marinomonas sp. THO17 TaxID=3149048 RepID=UPI00336C02C7